MKKFRVLRRGEFYRVQQRKMFIWKNIKGYGWQTNKQAVINYAIYLSVNSKEKYKEVVWTNYSRKI